MVFQHDRQLYWFFSDAWQKFVEPRYKTMAYFCTCTFIDPLVRKGNKTFPDANTHSIVKQNYVKKLKRKRKNIQYKKRERKKGKENYLPRQYSKSGFLPNRQFNQLQQVASSKKSFSCRSKKIVLIKYSLSFNRLN